MKDDYNSAWLQWKTVVNDCSVWDIMINDFWSGQDIYGEIAMCQH